MQKTCPSKGDWFQMIQEDFQIIKLKLSDSQVMNMSKFQFKRIIKKHIQSAAFQQYIEVQKSKSKIKNIEYTNLKTQEYLLSNKFTNSECFLLFKLRSRMIDIKENFKSSHLSDMKCRKGCVEIEEVSHLLKCPVLVNELTEEEKYQSTQISIKFIHETVLKQLKITRYIKRKTNQ